MRGGSRITSWLTRFPQAAGGGVAAVGALALTGWLADAPLLRADLPGFAPIPASTALFFLWAGLALALLAPRPAPPWRRILGLTCAGLAAAWGLAHLVEFVFTAPGVGGRIFADLAALTRVPFEGGNSVWSVVQLGMLGCAPLFLNVRRIPWAGELLVVTPLALTFLGLVAEVFRVTTTAGPPPDQPSALLTVLTFLSLELGLLLARPDRGWMAILTGDDLGGALARRLLPIAVLIPFGTFWLRLLVEQAGLLPPDLAAMLNALAIIFLQSILILWYAAAVSRTDRERKEAEQALKVADARKDEFLATLAHELRNPLAPIRNGLQILRLAGHGGEPVERAVAMMERQMGQMVRLIDDLLDLSRISRGLVELRKERVALSAVVAGAVETCEPVVRGHGHELTVTLPEGPVYVDADPTRLAQALCNLLHNAAKYSGRGGRIWLTAGREGGEAVLRVKDTGVGIPADMLSRVFDMFVQVDRSLEKAHGGLGIGLTIVKRLVEMHGGTVEARSEGPGMGSEFLIRLPAVGSGEAEGGGRDGVSGPGGRSTRRVLVVDDNVDAASSLAMLLEVMGNEVRTAHDGLEAVEAASAFRPDLILLDIGMPKLNGYDACRRIRAEAWGKEMAVVALTGWGQDEDRRRSREAGFNRHLVKPVEPATLETLLASLSAAGSAG